MRPIYWCLLVLLCLPLALAACDASGDLGGGSSVPGYTPEQMRAAYGITSLYDKGMRGKGQTIVVIESYGSPTLQHDMDVFCQQFGLPSIKLKVISPLGTKPYDASNKDMRGWVGEASEDVALIHALAPDANIVVMTSPVDETEGTIGLPEFLQLEQYAVEHHLGNIISMSFGASEYTLRDDQGQQEISRWNDFFHQATTQQGITFFASSGDEGATDYADLDATRLVPNRTSSFPNDVPWVTSVGGTTLDIGDNGSVTESAWNGSGGGFSAFFSQPDFQQSLPSSTQDQFDGQRGLPDVAAAADPATGMAAYNSVDGWFITSGTSAGAPTWAALTAIANQMAGHSLGFLNPALYQIGTSDKASHDFRDITSGNNDYSAGGVSVTGYPATKGWDPVTGLGAPIADHLIPDLIAALKR
jgi:subtilase family serine protease